MFTAKHCRYGVIAAILIGMTNCVSWSIAADEVKETKAEHDQRMAWWREARFGMFIHWGLYAVPAGSWNGKRVEFAGEWIMNKAKIPVKDYANLASQFNPVKFDADQWVKLAKRAGMKYIVITSKHHDGFAMFHSKASPYNIYDATPFHRDPLKELAEACQKNGIKLGFYYSQAQDWHHPGGRATHGHWDKAQEGDMDEYLRKIAVPQVREILSNYGPIAILWWDTPNEMTRKRCEMFEPLLKLQPGIITNNRLGSGHPGDTDTPEGFIPATGFPGRDWEVCMTMNNTWGYRSFDHSWKSTKTLVRQLVDIASKGGNYLLNVGPTAEGVIPEASVERLEQVGKWMDVNSESIYGTTASPFKRLAWGRCTQKPGKLYLHVFDWPKGDLLVPGLKNHVTRAYLLADATHSSLPVTATQDSVAITLPPKAPDDIDSVVALDIKGDLNVVVLPIVQSADGSAELKAADADLQGERIKYESRRGQGNIGAWMSLKDAVSWDFDVQKPGSFDVEIKYACDNRSAGSEFDAIMGDQKLSGKVENTGGWDTYVSRKLGTLSLNKAGRYTLKIKATKKPNEAVMNLRSVTLKPVSL